MPHYLVAIHRPEGYDPAAVEDGAMTQGIHALNREMIEAGVRVFAGGLEPPAHAVSLRARPDGEVAVSRGPYLPAPEHVGGFWILETADLDAALGWARKAVVACRAPVEVRPILYRAPAAKAQ